MMPKWIISDTHFFHDNIRTKYCPWRQTWATGRYHMVKVMRESWNERVGGEDVVLHLGDFALGGRRKVKWIVQRLNGQIILVRGNHDMTNKATLESGFKEYVRRFAFDHPQAGRVVCRHRPYDFTQTDLEEADLLLFGHLHGCHTWTAPNGKPAIDVSVDALQCYHPVLLDSLL